MTTEAGKRLLSEAVSAENDPSTWNTQGYGVARLAIDTMVVIEAEAVTTERTRIAGAVRELKLLGVGEQSWSENDDDLVSREAVLAILESKPKEETD
jgi:hypothetical protein